MTDTELVERISILEVEADASQRKQSDLDTRLRTIERTVWTASGGLAAFQLIIKYVLP